MSSMYKNILGIDPGLAGGWALRVDKSSIQYGIMPVAGDVIDVLTIVRLLEYLHKAETMVVIEKQQAFPLDRRNGAFKNGTGYGQLIGMCQTLKVPYTLVSSQRWKKIILADTKKDKDAAIAYVKRTHSDIELLIPGTGVGRKKPRFHDGIADAVCILDYGVQKYA